LFFDDEPYCFFTENVAIQLVRINVVQAVIVGIIIAQ